MIFILHYYKYTEFFIYFLFSNLASDAKERQFWVDRIRTVIENCPKEELLVSLYYYISITVVISNACYN